MLGSPPEATLENDFFHNIFELIDVLKKIDNFYCFISEQ
jgi:hypothetical protein